MISAVGRFCKYMISSETKTRHCEKIFNQNLRLSVQNGLSKEGVIFSMETAIYSDNNQSVPKKHPDFLLAKTLSWINIKGVILCI